MGEAELLERGYGKAEDEGVSAREEGEEVQMRMSISPCDNLVSATSPGQVPLDAPPSLPLDVRSLRVKYLGRAPRSARLCS